MFSMRRSLLCFSWNLRLLSKNFRFYMGLFLGLTICFFLTEKTISLAATFRTEIQLFEPFIWCFGDSDSVLFASLALLLPLSQIPCLNAAASPLIFRAGRINWVLGQIITVIVISLFYTVFLFLMSMLFLRGTVITGNTWSRTATIMSFAPEYLQTSMTIARRIIKQMTPYEAASMIFFLVVQYMLFLSLMNLAVSLVFGKKAGMNTVAAISFICCFLTPDRFMHWLGLESYRQLTYIANLYAAWSSPLQHATYLMHSNGYNHLPTVYQSHLIMGSANVILMVLCFLLSKKMRFIFRPGEADE